MKAAPLSSDFLDVSIIGSGCTVENMRKKCSRLSYWNTSASGKNQTWATFFYFSKIWPLKKVQNDLYFSQGHYLDTLQAIKTREMQQLNGLLAGLGAATLLLPVERDYVLNYVSSI